MALKELKKLIRIIRKDPSSQCLITGAPNYPSLVARIISLGAVHNLKIDEPDVEKAILELNKLRAKPPRGIKFNAEELDILQGSIGSVCWDFPFTTNWTNVATAGNNPCCLQTPRGPACW